MMAKQVNFFMMPQDERLFLDFVFKEPDIELITSHNNTSDIRIIDESDYREGVSKRGSDYLFWKKSFPIDPTYIRQIEFKDPDEDYLGFIPTAKTGYWLDTFMAPVIEYMPSKYLGNGIINRGRIYIQTGYIKDGIWVAKAKEFVSWYERIARWLRKNFSRTSESNFFYLGPTLVKLHQEGKVKYSWLQETHNPDTNEMLLKG